MSWKDLLQKPEGELIVAPWLGGRTIRLHNRVFTLEARNPHEYGWHEFRVTGRRVMWVRAAEAHPEELKNTVHGYLVGDRLIADGSRVDPDPRQIVGCSEKVYLIEDGLDRFVRITAGRFYEDSPLVYQGMAMPLGPEEQVMNAFLDKDKSVDAIVGVPPALDAAFRMETWQRAEVERRRLEEERRRQEEQIRLEAEERRRALREKMGDGAGRRAMAVEDFGQAAQAALAIGGAEYLDHRRATRRGEMAVRFRLNNQRFECTCDERTLRIIDSGICLTAHYDDPDFDGGTKGDGWFSLESLPGVIAEAIREGKLVVYRHVY